MKSVRSTPDVASDWIVSHIPKNEVIGLENIPIYQNIPNILQKEFYFDQYKVTYDFNYKYKIIDAKTKKFPPVVVLTNDLIENKVYHSSPKKDLILRLKKEGYKQVVVFYPDFTFNKIGEIDYYFSWLGPIPNNISVYTKSNYE